MQPLRAASAPEAVAALTICLAAIAAMLPADQRNAMAKFVADNIRSAKPNAKARAA